MYWIFFSLFFFCLDVNSLYPLLKTGVKGGGDIITTLVGDNKISFIFTGLLYGPFPNLLLFMVINKTCSIRSRSQRNITDFLKSMFRSTVLLHSWKFFEQGSEVRIRDDCTSFLQSQTHHAQCGLFQSIYI